MKTTVPDYYNKFKCIAKTCTHNCCIGWEIDIDPDTLKKYSELDGDIREKLDSGIEDGHFLLTEDERCPFLNKNGLCNIITELGEDALCQICRDHPRFSNFFSNHTEIGLGLCCEEVTRIILSQTKPFYIQTEKSDDPLEQYFFKFRSTVFDILQDREFFFDERVENLLIFLNTDIPDFDALKYKEFLLTLEIMDDSWRTLVADMSQNTSKSNDIIFEQLICYFVFRHLTDALDDGDFIGRIKMCILFCDIIASISNCGYDIHDVCRIFSAEIEYSDENVQRILDTLI